MPEPVAWNVFAWTVGGLATAGVVQIMAIWKMFQTVHRRISNSNRELDQFQLQVSKEYVSVPHLAEVEARQVTETQGLRSDVKDLIRAVVRLEAGLDARRERPPRVEDS